MAPRSKSFGCFPAIDFSSSLSLFGPSEVAPVAILMMTHYLIRENQDMTREEIREKLHGNYCMCTGYQQIVDAVQDAQKKYQVSKK